MLSSRPISVHRDYYDVPDFTSKTPGRALKGRAGLQENALHHGSLTANPKEKRAILQTPFKKDASKNVLQDSLSSKQIILTNRLLVDKTPLPNRQNRLFYTPLPQKGKLAQLGLPALDDETENENPARPPSSSRKSLRAPRSSIKNYETPDTKGDHWNVSDISINAGEMSLDKVDELDLDVPDYSEPEYMPLTPVELPYEPPFDMPDYKRIGQALMSLSHSCVTDEFRSPPEINETELLEGCFSPDVMDRHVVELEEDDIFPPKMNKVIPKPHSAAVSRRPLNRPASNTTSRTYTSQQARSRLSSAQPARPATSVAIRPPTSRNTPSVPRAGTAASVKQPVQRSTNAPALINGRARNAAHAEVRPSSQKIKPAQKEQTADDLAAVFSQEFFTAPDLSDDFRFEV